MVRNFYTFGPLIAKVESTGIQGMLRVNIMGKGEALEVYVPGSPDHMKGVAAGVLLELYEAARKPRLFMARRRMLAENSGESDSVKAKMLSIAEKALEFSRIMDQEIERAVKSDETVRT